MFSKLKYILANIFNKNMSAVPQSSNIVASSTSQPIDNNLKDILLENQFKHLAEVYKNSHSISIEQWEEALTIFNEQFSKHLNSFSEIIGVQPIKYNLAEPLCHFMIYKNPGMPAINPETLEFEQINLDVMCEKVELADVKFNYMFDFIKFLQNPALYADQLAHFYIRDIISDLILLNEVEELNSVNLSLSLQQKSNKIATETRRSIANFIICNENTVLKLASTSPEFLNNSNSENYMPLNNTGITCHSMNLFTCNLIADDIILMGYKSPTNQIDTGYVLTPHIPLNLKNFYNKSEDHSMLTSYGKNFCGGDDNTKKYYKTLKIR